jgi:hypothetical protein
MKERTIWGVLGFVIGAVSGWLARALLLPPPIERPPIIVRGGSIWFDTDAGWTEADEKAGGDEGPESAEHWKQYDPECEYDPVSRFIVKIRNRHGAERTLCTTERLTFEHDQKKFRVVIQNNEPRLKPRGQLKKVEGSQDKRVKYSDGAGSPIIVKCEGTHSEPYELLAGEEVWIEPR